MTETVPSVQAEQYIYIANSRIILLSTSCKTYYAMAYLLLQFREVGKAVEISRCLRFGDFKRQKNQHRKKEREEEERKREMSDVIK